MTNQNRDQQLEQLLKMASSRLGTDLEQLKNAAQTGTLENLFSGISSSDAEKVQKVISDKSAAEKLLSSPQAQQLLKKLLEGK